MNPMRGILQRRFVLIVALLSFAAAMAAQTPEWKTFSYPADGFSASLPSEPLLQKKNVATASGTFELRFYTVQSPDVALFIGVCDYGAEADHSEPSALLEGAKNGALANSNSHLISEKKITLGPHPGIEFEAASDQAHLTARIYLLGTTLYQTFVVSSLAHPYDDAARFLDSFQLIPRVTDSSGSSN